MNYYDKKRKAMENGFINNSMNKKPWRGAISNAMIDIPPPITGDYPINHSSNGLYYGGANSNSGSSLNSYRDSFDVSTQWGPSAGEYRGYQRPAVNHDYQVQPIDTADNYNNATYTSSHRFNSWDQHHTGNNGYINGYYGGWGTMDSHPASSYSYNSSNDNRPPNRSGAYYLHQPHYNPQEHFSSSVSHTIDSYYNHHHHHHPNRGGYADLTVNYHDTGVSSSSFGSVVYNGAPVHSKAPLPPSSSSSAMPPTTSSYSVWHNKYYSNAVVGRSKKDSTTKLVSMYKPRLYSFGNKKSNKLAFTGTHRSPKASSVVKNEPCTSSGNQGSGEGQDTAVEPIKEPEKPRVIQSSAVRELLDVRIAVLDYHIQFALMRIGLGPKTEGRKTVASSSMQTNQEAEATTKEVTNTVVADAVAKESEGAKSSSIDTAVTEPTTANAKVGSQYVPPPPPPVLLLKKTLRRSESDAFAMKNNKIVGDHSGGLPPVPQTIKRTSSLPTRGDDSKSKSPSSRQFVAEVTFPSKTKPKPPTSTPPIIKSSSDQPSEQADDIPPSRRPFKTATADNPSQQVPAVIDPLPPGPPTAKLILPQPPKNYNPPITKSSHVTSVGPHQLPFAPKGFAQSIPPPPDSYGQLPPTMPMPLSATISHPPRAPTNGMFMPLKDSSHGPPQPKISNQSLKAINPPLSAHLPPRGPHNQMPLPPKSNSLSSRGPNNQMPLPPRGDHPPPSGLQKPAITKSNGHFPPPPKYNSHCPPPHKSTHQLTAPLPKGSSGGSYPSPYTRPASTDRTSPIDYVSHDFTHSDFDDYNSTSSGGRDISSRLYPYRKNGTYSNGSWSDPKGVVYCNEEGLPVRDYRGQASYDPYYYPVEVAKYAEYDHSRREYVDHDHHHHHHEGYSAEIGGHYYYDGRSNSDHPVASRYFVSDADDAGRRYSECDYDRVPRGGSHSGDNHSSFTPTYRSRSPVPINTVYSGGGAVGSCYVPSPDFHASNNLSLTPGGGKGHHNKNIASNSNTVTSSNYIAMPPHKAKQTSPLVAPPPLPPRRSIELSPTSVNALKTPR